MIGQTLGPYEILAKIGEGGMGEVYRARDPKLGRDVAIKILPEHRLESQDARDRFQREARAVAALSHPNILAIFDFGEHAGVAYAVTELLEGETLAEALREGALPLRRALDVAAQMADGLAAAHEKGIVHRDIKPANVFLTRDGRVKILDFGLAKEHVVQEAETIAATKADVTTPGQVLGTVRYMSPEQVRAEAVDHRADIFSFGAVLWEMLVGRPAFERDSNVESMTAILKEDPSTGSLPADAVPASVDRIIHRCLEKAPAHRFQSAQDLGFAVRNALGSSSHSHVDLQAVLPATGGPRWGLLAGALVCFLVGTLVGAWVSRQYFAPAPSDPVKVIPLTRSGLDSGPSASPDGKMVAFVSRRDGRSRIWLRQMSGGTEAPLTDGTDIDPRFSPDGSSVMFLRYDGLVASAHRVPVVGGAPRKLIERVLEAAWSPDGREIVFLRATGDSDAPVGMIGIWNEQTGETRELAGFVDRFAYGLDWSPDGSRITFVTTSAVLNTGGELTVIDAVTGEVESRIVRRHRLSAPTWTPDSERLIVAESTSLVGDISSSVGRVLRVDPATEREIPLFWVQSVYAGAADLVRFDFMPDGSLVFDEILWRGSLTEIELDGEGPFDDGRNLTYGQSRDRQPVYSPDGSKVLFSSNRSGNLDLWVLDRNTGAIAQLTDDESDDWDPAYTPDGRNLLWSSDRGGHLEIWIARADGSGARQLTQDGVDAENPTQTPDGQWVVYGSGNADRNGIWRIRADGSEEHQIAEGAYLLPEVSPDGKYVACSSVDPGGGWVRLQVHELLTHEQVFSTEIPFTGFQNVIQPGRARWMPDGRSLVFVVPLEDGRNGLFRQDFRPGEDTLATRRPLVVFDDGQDIESFGISRDGRYLTVAGIDHSRTLKLAEGDFTGRR